LIIPFIKQLKLSDIPDFSETHLYFGYNKNHFRIIYTN